MFAKNFQVKTGSKFGNWAFGFGSLFQFFFFFFFLTFSFHFFLLDFLYDKRPKKKQKSTIFFLDKKVTFLCCIYTTSRPAKSVERLKYSHVDNKLKGFVTLNEAKRLSHPISLNVSKYERKPRRFLQ